MNVLLLSDNELEVCSKKAAIGRGFDFAHAERLGRWIVTLVHTPLLQEPPANLLLSSLNQHHVHPGAFEPSYTDNTVSNDSASCTLLCANSSLAQYTAAVDFLNIEPDHSLQISATSYPLLLLAEILIRLDYQGGHYELRIPDTNLVIKASSQSSANEISLSSSLPLHETQQILAQPCKSVIAQKLDSQQPLQHQQFVNFSQTAALAKKNNIDRAVWSRVIDCIKLTMVPESEASRIAGAGAGLTDND